LAQADLYERIRQQTPVPITERDVERVLTGLLVAHDLWELVDLCDVPLAALPILFEECGRAGLIERRGDRLELTPAGETFVQEQGWSAPLQSRCPRCEGRGLDLEIPTLSELLERFREAGRDRPQPRQSFDQGYVTPETTVARVALMRTRGDFDGKRLLILGDDDLLGLAAALAGGPRRITVLEVDPGLVAFIEGARERFGLDALEIRQHDLRNPLPDALLGAYDTFATDPVESLEGCKLFLGRGLSALAGLGGAGYFGLTRHEASLLKWHQLQSWVLGQGAAITDCIDDFNAYVNWPYWGEMRASRWLGVETEPTRIWYRSTMIRFELVEQRSYPNEPFTGTFEDPELATT
jgi:predicted methyltransferase